MAEDITIPTVRVKKAGEFCTINAVDLPDWEANGWSLVEDSKPEVPKDKPEG